MHQPVRKRIATGVILLTVLVLLLFSARNLFVRKYIDRKLEKIEEVRRLSIHYDDIHMLGLSGIQIDGVSVIPVSYTHLIPSPAFGGNCNYDQRPRHRLYVVFCYCRLSGFG